ncbi:MAG: site-specific integrase [Candidatus Levyibacteriota bacterium]
MKSYREYLLKDHSFVTVKNYISDVNHFINWTSRELGIDLSPDMFSRSVIDNYYTSLLNSSHEGMETYSHKSLKRHLSSLRSFTLYLESRGFLEHNPFLKQPVPEAPNPWKIDEFKTYLYKKGSSKLTIKYYINDIQSFSRWYKEVSAYTGSIIDVPDITNELLNEYINRLKHNLDLAPTSINRKLSSIRNYLEFIKQETLSNQDISIRNIPSTHPEQIAISELVVSDTPQKGYSGIPPVRLGQKLLAPYFSFEEKISGAISSELVKYNMQKLVKKTKHYSQIQKIDEMIKGLGRKNIPKEFYAPHQVSIASYPLHKKLIFHLRHTRPEWYKTYHNYAFVHYVHFAVLVIVAVGAGIFAYDSLLGNVKAQEGASLNSTFSRTFIFKGRLLDSNSKPITESSHIRLAIYDTPTSSGSALLWQEVQTVKPSGNGDVNLIIGSSSPIPDAYFTNNMPLYLGVTVGNSPELSPRKQLGIPFADTAGSVQGYIPNTLSDRQNNVLLALDSTGNLSIGGNASPTFQATGGDFTLSGQTLVLQTNASSDGNVIINPDGNGKIDLQKPLVNSTSPAGYIEVRGGVSVSATDSAHPALQINQESGAPLISANTQGATRFAVDSQGVITKGYWAGTPIGTEFGGFGADVSATGPGELLYSTSSISYGHLSAGVAGQCLNANGRAAPVWSTCGFLSQLNGAATFTNNTLDFLLGNTSTGSAKFALTNVGQGTPTFKVGNNLQMDSNGSIATNNTDLTLGGGSTKNVAIMANSNVGINQTNPTRTLDVNGNLGGNVDYYSDGAGNQTILRATKALIYDLEKNTGSSNTSTTTTYNIVGLPEVDGTIAYIYAKVTKGTTPGSPTQTISIQINSNQISTVSTVPGSAPSTQIKHYMAARSNGTWHLLGDYGTSDTADLSEWIPASTPLPLPGSVVSFDGQGNVDKPDTAYDPKLAGIISTNPHIVIGPQTANSVRLALSGRVPVMVTSLNGPILTGDPITSSPLPGFGMKPSKNAAVVGKAMQSFNPQGQTCQEVFSLIDISWPSDDGTNPQKPCFKVRASFFDTNFQNILSQKYGVTSTDYIYVGKVMAMAGLTWSSSPDLLTSVESIELHDEAVTSLDGDLTAQMEKVNSIDPTVTVSGKAVNNVGVFSGLFAGKIKASLISATKVLAQNIIADTAVVGSLSVKSIDVTGSLTIQGKPLQAYIGQVIDSALSPLVSTNILSANIISPLAGNSVAVELPEASDSAFLIKNKGTGQNVTQIDTHGNITTQGSLQAAAASFSGQLTAGDASFSGTLRASSILADDINGLDQKVATVAADLIARVKPVQNIPSSSFGEPLADVSLQAKFGTFSEGLLSLGASTFGNISVMDMLSIGSGSTFTLSQGAINTLGTDLQIQPLRQAGVSFMAGAVIITPDGQLQVNEDALFNKNLAVKGTVYTNLVSPLPNSDLSVQLGSESTSSAGFAVRGASSSAVLRVNNTGDVVASGSGTFAKINISMVGQALAANENEAVATGSAGTAVLKANKTQLTILNPLITDHSLIYITPAQNTYNQVLFLMRQDPKKSFTVGVSQPISQDIEFNWLIVN